MRKASIAAVAVSTIGLAAAPLAFADNSHRIGTNLIGYQEVPAVSTVAKGDFEATINRDETEITYELSYRDLEGAVTQAHIHFGQRSVNGGISVWLCGNPPLTPPPGTPLCPPSPATVSGTLTSEDVVGPTAQGIAPTELAELIRAIRAGVTYTNVHTSKFPGGEIRGQLDGRGRHHQHDHDDD